MSCSDSEIHNKIPKYPPNYLEVQNAQEEEAFIQEMEANNGLNQTDSTYSSATITQDMFCNNCNKRLRQYLNVLVVLFLLTLFYGAMLLIDRKSIIEQNSKILAEYKHHQRLYNNHIDNSIGYIQQLIDLLIKTQGSLSRLKLM